MKFQCDRCKTRYSIADDKVRGKVLKIRCKNCETVITVKEGMEAPIGVSGSTMSFPAVTGAMPRVTGAFGAAGALGGDEEATRVSAAPTAAPAPAPAPPAPADADEWFVSVDGNQQGPFTLAQARERVGKKRPSEEMHGWKEDFADWLPVERIRELAPYLPKRPAPPPPPRPQPRPSASVPAIQAQAPKPAPLAPAVATPAAPPLAAAPVVAAPVVSVPPIDHGADGPDLAISEPSRVIKIPQPKNGTGDHTSGPVASASRGNGAHDAAHDSMSFPAARDSMSFPAAMAGSPQMSMSMSMSIPVVERKRPVVLYVAGLAALIAVVVVVVVVITSRGPEEGTSAADTTGGGSSDYIADVYKGRKVAPDRVVPKPVDETPTIAVPDQTPSKPQPRPTNVVKTSKARDGGTTTTNPDPLGKEESVPTTTEREDPVEPLSPDDVSAMYRANESGLKWCYERALKADPLFKMNKINVTISIEKSGAVSKIDMPDQASTLGICLTSRIRAWRFRKSTDGLNMQFDIMFARRE